MFAEFIHYYPGYTAQSVLREYAVTFYALLGAMYRIKAMDRIEDTYSRAASTSGAALDSYLQDQRRQAGGGHAILEEVLTVKQAQQKNVN